MATIRIKQSKLEETISHIDTLIAQQRDIAATLEHDFPADAAEQAALADTLRDILSLYKDLAAYRWVSLKAYHEHISVKC